MVIAMLKRALKKRFIIIISSLTIILCIYLFPPKQENKYNEFQNKNTSFYLYLLDTKNLLSRVAVYVPQKEPKELIIDTIDYLTINGKNTSYLKNGFTPIIPTNTKLLSLDIDKKIVKLNFSKEFLNINAELAEKLISSLVYSITEINSDYKITIYVENNLLTKLANINIPTIIDRSFGINNTYDINKPTGTIQTTVYYLSKENDYYYYVPVTYINNKTDDKIKIIIEEMASKTIYKTNLISYLKDIEKMTYEIQNDEIVLNLASQNFSSSNLIEEVIYTFNLSIKDNYNIKQVTYYIDNKLYANYKI